MSISISGDGTFTGVSTNYSFDQSVSVGGTVTYEDVTNVDSIGVITARNGIEVTGGNVHIAGVGATIGVATAYISSINDLGYPTAGPLSNRNLIINGAMNIAQRGTSSTVSGYGSVDRFHIQWNGGTTTHTQTAITSGSPYDEGFRNVLRLTNTTAATGAGDYRNPFQYIEAQNLAQSGWNYTSSSSYVTLSFWVRSSVTQEFYGYLRTFDGTEQSYSFSTGTLSANTWTKVTKVIPGNSNITIDNDAGGGLQVNISPFWGINFTDPGNTTESWGAFSSGSRTPVYTNTWANTTNATFDITGLQLEVGTRATPFEHRSYGDELARCQRYFHVLQAGRIMCVSNGSGVAIGGNVHFPTTMRSGPNVTYYGGNSTSGTVRMYSSEPGNQTNYDTAATNFATATNGGDVFGWNASSFSPVFPAKASGWIDLGTATNNLKMEFNAEL